MTEASRGLVANMMVKLPMNISGARVNIRRLISTIICIWLLSLVSRVNSWPVVKSSRLPKLKVCIFLNTASRRSASKLLATLTAYTVLTIISNALSMLAPIMRMLVLITTSMSLLAMPSSMITCTSLGMERSVTTTRLRSTTASTTSLL